MPLEEGGRPMPLEEAEVEERLRAWREQGYDVEKIGEDHQKMAVFPEEVRGKKVDASEIIVSIPDRRGKLRLCGESVSGLLTRCRLGGICHCFAGRKT